MSKSRDNLIWMNLEMTGLDLNAIVLLKLPLSSPIPNNILAEGPVIAITSIG